jgi:metallo-beta-lactamase family protein
MKISFHGAAQDVTGSCHLVEAAGRRILVDCGLFQGSQSLREDNKVPFGFNERDIDCVLLTHAHLDHCGRLPLLVKRGFRGEIIATQATTELARLVLLDSANLQEEDAREHTVAIRKPIGTHLRSSLYTPSSTPRIAWPVSADMRLTATPWRFARVCVPPSTMPATFWDRPASC